MRSESVCTVRDSIPTRGESDRRSRPAGVTRGDDGGGPWIRDTDDREVQSVIYSFETFVSTNVPHGYLHRTAERTRRLNTHIAESTVP